MIRSQLLKSFTPWHHQKPDLATHPFRQALLHVPVDLAGAGVEDAVDTEVELGAIDLKNFALLGDEFVVFALIRLLGVRSGAALRRKAETGCCPG